MDQNINKRKGRVIKTVCEIPFYFSMWLISGFFLSFVKIPTCQDQNFWKKCCNSSKKQISSISNTKWRAKLVDHKFLFCYFARCFPYNKSFQILQSWLACVVHVLCAFSTECLKTSREFSLRFENTITTSCCFIVSFRWQTSLYISIMFRCIYIYHYTR